MIEYFSWYLIYEHIMESSDDYFDKNSDPLEVLSCNKKHKYSVIGFVESHLSLFRNNGRYEFKLEYPEINKINHWTQTVFPTRAASSTENGYKEIDCPLQKKGWHGLSLSNRSETYIDGSPFINTWFCPIGQYGQYFNGGDCLPNPEIENSQECLSTTRLWIKRYQRTSKRYYNFFLNIYIFILVIIK